MEKEIERDCHSMNTTEKIQGGMQKATIHRKERSNYQEQRERKERDGEGRSKTCAITQRVWHSCVLPVRNLQTKVSEFKWNERAKISHVRGIE